MIAGDNGRDRAVRKRAYALADSGKFGTVHDIERALIAEGWPNAGAVLRSGYVHQAVEERCAHAKPH